MVWLRNNIVDATMTQYRLMVDDEKWEEFKSTLRKTETINDKIEGWIDQHIEEVKDGAR